MSSQITGAMVSIHESETKGTKCKLCKNHTSERKPYCIDHLDMFPYVREVMRVDALCRRDVGFIAEEVLAILSNEAMTPLKIATRLEVDVSLLAQVREILGDKLHIDRRYDFDHNKFIYFWSLGR